MLVGLSMYETTNAMGVIRVYAFKFGRLVCLEIIPLVPLI